MWKILTKDQPPIVTDRDSIDALVAACTVQDVDEHNQDQASDTAEGAILLAPERSLEQGSSCQTVARAIFKANENGLVRFLSELARYDVGSESEYNTRVVRLLEEPAVFEALVDPMLFDETRSTDSHSPAHVQAILPGSFCPTMSRIQLLTEQSAMNGKSRSTFTRSRSCLTRRRRP